MKHLLTLALVLCLGTFASAQIPSFTKIGPNVPFINVIKRANGNFVASADQDVFEFSGLNGTFNSLNFTNQLGNFRCISELLGENSNNQIYRSTCDNGIYKYSNGQWSFNSLSGFGTGGQFWNKLSNGRLIFTKGGFLRNIYYSDNDGASWTSSSVGGVDWNHLILGASNNLFAVSRYGQAGIIKSTNNGTNWAYLNSNVPLSTANCIFYNGQALFVIADNTNIKKSNDDGNTWSNFSTTPNGEDGQEFIQLGKYYFLYTYSNGAKLYYSDTSNINWINISSNLASNLTGIRLKVIDQTLFAATNQGLFYFQQPQNCNLTVNLAPSDTLAACGNSVNLDAGNPGANYLWNTGDSTPSISATQSGWYSVTVNQNNCSATDSVYVNLLQVDLGNDTTVCRGNSLNIQPKGSISKILSNPTFSEVLKYQGRSYLVYNQMMTWEDAKKLGDSLGLQMYVINDQAEENAVYAALPEKGNDGVQYWLGLYQEINGPFYSEPAGGWRWVDGRYLNQGYSNWYPGEPSNGLNDENYAQLEWDIIGKQWNDAGYQSCGCKFSKPIYETNNLFSSTLWSTGDTTPTINVTPTQTTTYYCTVSDGISTCTDSVTVFVTQPPVLSLPDTLRSATRPVVLAPGNASTYRWSTGDTTANLSVNTAGTYSVTASNAAGCSSADSVLVLFSNPAPALPAAAAGMFNYQASVVNGGKPLANRSLSVRFTVADSTATNYSEIQQITTDARGHFATQVGAGNPISGSLSDVSWWDGLPRTLKTEVDTNGSGNWVVLGSSSLVAVPVSMYALRSGDGSRSIYGSFDSNGNVVSGRGFSVTPLGNGKFELVFQQPFTELPIVFLEFTGNGVFSKKILSKNTQKTTIEITGNPDQIQFEAKGK